MKKSIAIVCLLAACGPQEAVIDADSDLAVDSDASPLDALTLDASGTVTSSSTGKRFRTATLPPGEYVFDLTGSGDADLFIRPGADPTPTAFACRPHLASSAEHCDVTLTAPARLHVWVRGVAASSAFRLIGRRNTVDCVVMAPPQSLGLDRFYGKHCAARGGIPVVASSVVPDRAIQQAEHLISAMTSTLPKMPPAMVSQHENIAIIGMHQVLTDLPEYKGVVDPEWDDVIRALSASPLTVGAEDNVLCYEDDWWHGGNVLLHEFAHTVKGMMQGLVPDPDPQFQARIHGAYDDAMARGLYKDLYAATNPEEYWAEGTTYYFNAHGPNADGRKPNNSEELKAYDPALWAVIDETFHGVVLPPSCPSLATDAVVRFDNGFFTGKSLTGAGVAASSSDSAQGWRTGKIAGGAVRLTNAASDGQSLAVVDGRVVMAATAKGPGQTWHIMNINERELRITNDLLGPGWSLAAKLDATGLVMEPTAQRLVQRWVITRR